MLIRFVLNKIIFRFYWTTKAYFVADAIWMILSNNFFSVESGKSESTAKKFIKFDKKTFKQSFRKEKKK
jgi:hypothetical protein